MPQATADDRGIALQQLDWAKPCTRSAAGFCRCSIGCQSCCCAVRSGCAGLPAIAAEAAGSAGEPSIMRVCDAHGACCKMTEMGSMINRWSSGCAASFGWRHVWLPSSAAASFAQLQVRGAGSPLAAALPPCMATHREICAAAGEAMSDVQVLTAVAEASKPASKAETRSLPDLMRQLSVLPVRRAASH